jgi:small subunit ribosomal protein S16
LRGFLLDFIPSRAKLSPENPIYSINSDLLLRIRLTRTGKKSQPSYRIVVAEHTAPVKSKFVEIVGNYNISRTPRVLEVKQDRVKYWISVGAKPTDSVAVLLKSLGMEDMDKFIVKPRDLKRKKRNASEEEEAAPAATVSEGGGDDAPAPEAPAEEAPADAAPAEEAAPDAPAEDAPAEDAPAEDAPAEDAPADDAPADDAPADDAPADDAPADEPAKDDAAE